jgi:hypothetical protein
VRKHGVHQGRSNNVKSMTRVVHARPCRRPSLFMSYTQTANGCIRRVVRSRQPERLSAWSGALAQTWWREAQMLWRRALLPGARRRGPLH